MKWIERYKAYLKRTNSRYRFARRERPDPPGNHRDMKLRRFRFGVRGGAFVYMFYRTFGKRPYEEKKFLNVA